MKNRHGRTLHLQDEISEKLKDLSMDGRFVPPELWELEPWMAEWVKERYRWEEGTYHRLAYEEFMEWSYRVKGGIELWKKMLVENPKAEELITTKWLGYLVAPPGFLTRPDLALRNFPIHHPITFVWLHLDLWRMEFDWAEGMHYKEGRPLYRWVMGMNKELAPYMGEEERTDFLDSHAFFPTNLTHLPHRRDWATGLRFLELPKKYSISPQEWFPAARNLVRDFLDETLPCWSKFPLVLSLSPSMSGIGGQQSFWGFSGFLSEVWLANQAPRLGWPFFYYGYDESLPEQRLMKITSREGFVRLMAGLYLRGPKGLLCDAVGKNSSPPKQVPFLYSIRRLTCRGKMFKGFALPFDEGIPPPRALLTALPAPIYRETTLKELNLWGNPENLSKEFKELLESEAGVDLKTGRVPSYEEVPRLKWLFDPTIEWLKPKDFPPIDWSKGQVWPLDLTREKMEIMVEEGYDGSGKDILHYSCLADRKMGQYGKTIMLGTMPYKLPEIH